MSFCFNIKENIFYDNLTRNTFASQITSGVAAPISDTKSNPKETRSSLYVLLRKYRGLKTSGYGVTSKAVAYDPYRLTLTFKEAPEEQRLSSTDLSSANSRMLLVIAATPVKSAYKGKLKYRVLYFIYNNLKYR